MKTTTPAIYLKISFYKKSAKSSPPFNNTSRRAHHFIIEASKSAREARPHQPRKYISLSLETGRTVKLRNR